jgi:hypothetical protein
MRTVHRAAWVAWAEWICNSAAAQAVDDMGPADFKDRRGLFFCAGSARLSTLSGTAESSSGPDVSIELLGSLLVGNRDGDDLERINGHAVLLAVKEAHL